MAKLNILKRMEASLEKTTISEVSRLSGRPLRIALRRYMNQPAAEFLSEVAYDGDSENGSGAYIRFRRCDE